MNVLIIGGGAREHALAWKLRRSPAIQQLFVAPGNAGTAAIATNVPLIETDFPGILASVRSLGVELVVIGPETPLANGISDFLAEHGVLVFGPSRDAAQIEWSKSWSKQLMRRHGIPTAKGWSFDDPVSARAFAQDMADAPVVKADGLAAGKGVVVAENLAEALSAVDQMMTHRTFGGSGSRVVLEERLRGREVSAHVVSDGQRAVPLPFACDHKAVRDGDKGPNTGGMGAYSPPGFIGATLAEEIFQRIDAATIDALKSEGRPYQGVLYPGLMLTSDGPKVIEFNCRFGDPETQVLLPRLRSDLLPLLLGAARGDLAGVQPEWDEAVAVGVVLASAGYPGHYKTGLPIGGLDAVDGDILVFHAGTTVMDGTIVTAGGRVLTVVGRGATIGEARARAYENVRRISFEGMHYRTDIGLRG